MSTNLYYAGPHGASASAGGASGISSTFGTIVGGGQVQQMPANNLTAVGTGYAAVGATPVQLPPLGFTLASSGNDTVTGGQSYPSVRFETTGGFINTNLCADLVMPGGRENNTSWYINLYTINATPAIPVFPPTSTLFYSGPQYGHPGSGTTAMHSSTNGALAGGFQPIYIDSNFFPFSSTPGNGGTNPWLRFCTNTGVVNGQNVVDLVMFGSAEAAASWVLVVYAVSGGFLT